MTTQIDVVDINDNTNDNTDETTLEQIKPEEVKPKAKPRAKAKVKEVTEEVKQEVTEESLAAGMNDIMVKPFDPSKLFQVVAKNIKNKKSVD